MTYGAFGWLVEENNPLFQGIILEQGRRWQWHQILHWIHLTEEAATIGLVYILAAINILAIVMGLIAPVTLITIAFGSSFQSDAGSIISILLWSFAVVFLIRWVGYFAQLLLLVCAAILVKLDLQDNGYSNWQVSSAIALLSFLGFILGIVGHKIGLT